MIEEAKNRFQRHDDAKKAKQVAAARSVEDRQAKRNAQKAHWSGPTRELGAVHGKGGTVLDPKTLAAKSAMEEDRAARKQEAINRTKPISVALQQEDMEAIVLAFTQKHPEFYDSVFNRTNLVNCVFHNLVAHKLSGFNIESLERVAVWLGASGYFEKSSRRPRGMVLDTPKVFPEYVDPTNDAIPGNLVRKNYTVVSGDEREHLQGMDFDSLQALARRSMKAYNADAGRES
jgi:hypothetical protein